ncbi:MAG: hypothetical protein FD149_1047 [Rhodospirillaceae bacterium]|nr:MAG: hypothetical protein FD149_1047 [Rhodospirillaceae bacterium]
MRFPRVFLFVLLLVMLLTGGGISARAAVPDTEEGLEAQKIVDHAVVTLERLRLDDNFQRHMLPKIKRARAVLVVPSLVKAGFILGAGYGHGVLMVRDHATERFIGPAFFKVMAGSIGLQAGVQEAEVVFIIMTEQGLTAFLDNKFKAGAGVSVAFIRGAAIEAATTSNVGADIYAFALTTGLFGGGALDGTIIESRTDWNNHFYGDIRADTRAILFERRFDSLGADRLRAILDRDD